MNELQPNLGDVALRCVSRVAVSFVVATADVAVSSVEFKFPGSVARRFEMAVGGKIFIDVEGVADACLVAETPGALLTPGSSRWHKWTGGR